MSDISRWNPSQGFGNSPAARQGRRELEQIAINHLVSSAREQAAAAETALAVQNTVALVRITNEALKECPEAAALVLPLVQSYARGAQLRIQWGF